MHFSWSDGVFLLPCSVITHLILLHKRISEPEPPERSVFLFHLYSSTLRLRMSCRTISVIFGRISFTETLGPQASTTLPSTSIRYFQKFQSGSFPVASKKENLISTHLYTPDDHTRSATRLVTSQDLQHTW